MADALIQGGTKLLYQLDEENFLYEYRYNTVEGEVVITFTANQSPKIGDSIVNDVLVPLEGYLINQDHSKWECSDEETWGRD